MFITSTFSVKRSRSLWPSFHAPAILLYILKTISWINLILGILVLCDTMIDIIINVDHLDLYFMVQWLWPYILNVIWCMNIIIWDYESVWSDSWPESKCRSLWPIFHGPMILCYILKTTWCMTHSLGLCDLYFIALWFCFISATIWCLSVIFTYNDTVRPKLWPQSKYKSAWSIFHPIEILLNSFYFNQWINIIVGIMDQCDTSDWPLKYM